MKRLLLLSLIALGLSVNSVSAKRVDQVEYPTYYAHTNGISLAYQEFGDPEDDSIVLIMGLGGQLIHWDDDIVWALVDAGFHVVRFDNRDAGWSTKLYDEDTPGIITGLRFKLGMSLNSPYKLSDMAADTVGLMDYLEIEQAHIVGMSMGGMIAQTIAGEYPNRVKTLTSIMSSSGFEELPPGSVELAVSKDNPTRDESIAASAAIGQQLDGTVAELTEAQWKKINARSYDRSHYPDGYSRQFWAILDSGDRVELLKNLKVPTLVIHGKEDYLLPPEHGQHTADMVPGSRLVMIEGMGHFIDKASKPLIIKEIINFSSN